MPPETTRARSLAPGPTRRPRENRPLMGRHYLAVGPDSVNIAGALPTVTPVTTAAEIVNARAVVREVYIDEKIEQYIADIVFATRYPDRYGLKDMKEMISFGGSPRASINLAKAARAYAFIKRRGYVVPEDVRAVAHDVLRHRIGLTYEAEASNVTSEEIVSKIINKVEVP